MGMGVHRRGARHPRLIIIGAPHTTNWDFVVYLGAFRHYRLHASYIGKHTLFRWPFGYLFRKWGGSRWTGRSPAAWSSRWSMSSTSSEQMVLVIAPEGTRGPAPVLEVRISQHRRPLPGPDPPRLHRLPVEASRDGAADRIRRRHLRLHGSVPGVLCRQGGTARGQQGPGGCEGGARGGMTPFQPAIRLSAARSTLPRWV